MSYNLWFPAHLNQREANHCPSITNITRKYALYRLLLAIFLSGSYQFFTVDPVAWYVCQGKGRNMLSGIRILVPKFPKFYKKPDRRQPESREGAEPEEKREDEYKEQEVDFPAIFQSPKQTSNQVLT